MKDGLGLGGYGQSRRRGVVIGISLSLLIGLVAFPFRQSEYELELLLVLPIVYVGALAGGGAAIATAVFSVFVFHTITRTGSNHLKEDLVALVTYLGSALVVGATVGRGADRLALANERELEQSRLSELNARLAENDTRMAVLEQVDQQRVALLRSVSHDLRTPLATIRAVATDLRDSDLYDASTRHELLKSVSDEAERLDRLVGNLLSMSRIEAGSMRIDDQAVDFAELLQLTVLRLGSVLSHVEIEVEIDDHVPLVAGDPVLLDEVVSNLLENAARYAPSGTTIEVQLATDVHDMVILRVRDHGPGVDTEHAEHVFQAFWRGPESRSSGLGLTIVRAIVHAHRGSIELDDTPGGGASFEVRLPARQDARL
ncbi:MAG: ATP-binding protein [Ilumatobacteraceae bacterium]